MLLTSGVKSTRDEFEPTTVRTEGDEAPTKPLQYSSRTQVSNVLVGIRLKFHAPSLFLHLTCAPLLAVGPVLHRASIVHLFCLIMYFEMDL